MIHDAPRWTGYIVTFEVDVWWPVWILLCACSPRDSSLQGHYEAVGALRTAVYQGDLALVHAVASRMEGGGEVGTDGERLHSALGFLQAAQDGDEAAAGLAAVACACGDCHDLRGVRARTFNPRSLPAADAVGFHVQVQNQLWDALVNHDEAQGDAMVQALALAPLFPRQGATATEVARGIHEAALQVSTSPRDHQREVFMRFAIACASCHRSSGVGF